MLAREKFHFLGFSSERPRLACRDRCGWTTVKGVEFPSQDVAQVLFQAADRPQVFAMIALVLAWFVHVQWPPPPITVMNGHASLCGAHGREASRSPNRFTPVCYAMVASGESTRYIGRPCLHETAVTMHDGLESIRILLSMETGWMVTAGVITRTFRFRLELC